MPFPTILGALTVAIWSWLLLARGRFWQAGANRAPRDLPSAPQVSVAAVIPARNEADVIAPVVRALLSQRDFAIPVYLVDDGSTDGTADAARSAAVELGQMDRLTIIPGQPLPPGWTGKLWAMQQGIERAMQSNPEWLLLADADVEQGPNTIARLAAISSDGPYDLASFMVKLHCKSWAEKLLIPAFVFFFFKLYPPAWIRDPHRSTAGAAGGCMLVRASALAQAGGIAAIRSALIDDCSLAALIKRNGGNVWLGLTKQNRSLRPYDHFRDVERMVARNAFYQLNHSALLLLGTVVGMSLLYLAPVLLLFSRVWQAAALGAIAWILMSVAYSSMVRFYRLHVLRALTLPVAALFYEIATIHSAFKYWTGSGGAWKGRHQDFEKARTTS
jgi:hopene-associated glycosyltransferase HpnB